MAGATTCRSSTVIAPWSGWSRSRTWWRRSSGPAWSAPRPPPSCSQWHSRPMAAADPLDPPLDVLVASHRRARQQFETMRELATRAPEAPVDAVARQAGQAVVCAVDQSTRLHHEVEQGVLFPELIESMAG